MSAKKRAYTLYAPEFKIKAVARFNATPVRQRTRLAKRLGVTYQHLYSWARRAEQGGVEALYGKPGRASGGVLPLNRKKRGGDDVTQRQQRVLNELTETCEELRKLRETYAEREAMVLSHIKRLTKSLGHAITPQT